MYPLYLTKKLHTLFLICKRFGTTKILILNLFEEQLTDLVGQERAFSNMSVNEKVSDFNNTIFNILSNFAPHDILICNRKDPPRFNKNMEAIIPEKK